MATIDRDVEAATPVYAPQASPKIDELLEERPASRGASTLQLLLASMPRMLIQMAWTAQFLAMSNVPTTRFATKLIGIISPLTSLLLSPVVGVMSDRCVHKWGRRRPFLVFGTLASVVILFIMCFARDIGEEFNGDSWRSRSGTSFVAVLFFLCSTIAITIMETPVNLLVADLAGERQITGAAMGQGWAILGSIFVVTYFQVITESSRGAFIAVCILLMLIIAGVTFYNIQETPREPSEARGVLATISSDMGPLPTMLIVYAVISVLIGYGILSYSSNRLMFFETRVVSDSDDYYSYYYSSDSSLGDYKYFMIQQVAAYVFTWLLPMLANKIGANHVLSISLGPQALLIIMAFVQSKTLVGLMDFAVTVFRGTIYVLVVPSIVHVYGTKNIGSYVGVLTSIGSVGQLIAIFIGDSVNETELGYQLPVLLAGIMAAVGIFISAFLLKLKLKSL